MRNLPRKWICVLIFFLGYLVAGAQSFQYKADLPKAPFDSFYRVSIIPAIVAKCKPGLADLRLQDKEGKAVPYFVQSQQPVFKEASFIEFPIVRRERGDDKQTHVVVSNSTGNLISELLLEIKNTNARREVTVSGSDDQENFFVISENIVLQNLHSQDGSAIQSLSFPPAQYKYFQVTILGKDVLPVNIVRAGTFKENYFTGEYVQLPNPGIKQVDSSDKKSYIYLTLPDNFQVEKMDLKIAGPRLFRRSIEIRDAHKPGSSGYFFDVTSTSTGSLPVHLKTTKLLVVVQNDDNPPVKIVGANLWQLSRSIVAYLQKGKEYTLFFGNNDISAPEYDLSYFADTVGSQVISLAPSGIEAIRTGTPVPTDQPSYMTQTTLWIIIIATLFVLLLVTFSLTRQVKKRKEES